MITIPLTKKSQEGFMKELPKLPHVKHNPDTNSGVISVPEKKLVLNYRLVVEVTVGSNPENIPESAIEHGLLDSLKVLV